MWLGLHLFAWVALVFLVLIGLSRTQEKRVNQFLILSRIFYLIIIVSGVILSIRTFQHAPLLVSLKAVLGLSTIGLIEAVFGRKLTGKASPQLNWLLGVVALLTIVMGFYLSFRH